VATNATLERLERDVRFNNRCTTALLALLAVLVAGTCAYVYVRARRLTDPERLVDLAEQRIKQQYPKMRAELKRELVKNAPALAKKLSRQGLTSIPDARARVERYVERRAEEGLRESRALTTRQFRAFLRENRPTIKKGFEELRKSPQRTKEFVLELEKKADAAFATDVRRQARQALAFLHELHEKLRRLNRPEKELAPAERRERRIARLLRAMQESQTLGARAAPPHGPATSYVSRPASPHSNSIRQLE
jgi:hypothetical protein